MTTTPEANDFGRTLEVKIKNIITLKLQLIQSVTQCRFRIFEPTVRVSRIYAIKQSNKGISRDSDSSSTTSVETAVLAYKDEYGRRYASYGRHGMFPLQCGRVQEH